MSTDTWIGDEVLLLLGRRLRSSFRYYDHLFWFGGEEFVVLMRCGGAADALGRNQLHDFAALVAQGHPKEEARDSDVELF